MKNVCRTLNTRVIIRLCLRNGYAFQEHLVAKSSNYQLFFGKGASISLCWAHSYSLEKNKSSVLNITRSGQVFGRKGTSVNLNYNLFLVFHEDYLALKSSEAFHFALET